MNATSAAQGSSWPQPGGPNSFTGVPGPHLRPLGPRISNGPNRPPRPFFVREIYKNGFLKRLPYNERKSSALSKLMKTDRYWVVFSVHDDAIPFLELWTEPTEVSSKPPHFMFPLAVCQHISPSLVPAGDHEWTFVINFETVAIRFSCNSRQTMEEWVDCIRNKLGEMGILNPKGNLYSKVPAISATKTRNPMSPLPQPPPAGPITNNEARTRTSIVDSSDHSNQSFTTSIYLNQTPPQTPQQTPVITPRSTAASTVTSTVTTTPAKTTAAIQTTGIVTPAQGKSYEGVTVTPKTTCASASVSTVASTITNNSASGATSSVYLNKSNPTRHVTVIPINSIDGAEGGETSDEATEATETAVVEEPYYDAIPEGNDEQQAPQKPRNTKFIMKKRQQSPSKQPKPPPTKEKSLLASKQPPAAKEKLKQPLEKKKEDLTRKYSDKTSLPSQPQRIKKKSQRSSSLGPLLDEQLPLASSMANTNSLESIDSNPRQKLPKGDLRERHHGRVRATGAVPRRPLNISSNTEQQLPLASSPTAALVGSPPRIMGSSEAILRPPPYMAPSGPPMPGTHPPHPPHIPLPGLTCQLSLLLPQPSQAPLSGSSNDLQHHLRSPSLREQQVFRLRQEIAHPAGVRLTLRKRDCQNSLALVEIFGCLWVGGWKQRDFPVLYNAFHIGDQILSVAGNPVRTASDFNKLVKAKSNNPSNSGTTSGPPQEVLQVEIIVRRLPFAQVFHLKREIDGQPLGLVLNGNTAEVREIVPSSPSAIHGMSARVRSLDGQALVPWHLTEVNGRPLNLMAKDGEAAARLQALGRDVSVLIQPTDFVAKLRKQLKAHKNYKDYLLG